VQLKHDEQSMRLLRPLQAYFFAGHILHPDIPPLAAANPMVKRIISWVRQRNKAQNGPPEQATGERSRSATF